MITKSVPFYEFVYFLIAMNHTQKNYKMQCITVLIVINSITLSYKTKAKTKKYNEISKCGYTQAQEEGERNFISLTYRNY